MTELTIEDPVESLNDDTLIAVLLLGLFEVSALTLCSMSLYLLFSFG